MKLPGIQKIKTPGDTAITADATVVLISAGAGVTRALLPSASASPSRTLLVVRSTELTGPAIVHRVAATGKDQIVSDGRLVAELELTAFGESVTLVAVEIEKGGAWLARRN